jgi:anhydro-N-acetylmuramic acid kinase
MTGTSLDGLDASLVEIEGEGLAMRARVVRSLSRGLGEVGPRLRAIAEQKPVTAGEIASVSRDFALLHASAIRELLAGERADLVCVHGQTVFHKPPLSWQLMQPAPIAHAVGCPVVYDLRQADLAAGGQGAPITPIADWVLFSDLPGFNAVANLGGYCNITLVTPGGLANTDARGRDVCEDPDLIASIVAAPPPRSDRNLERETSWVRAFDVCACNQLLDEIARRLMNQPYDTDGQRALSGSVSPKALDDLLRVLTAQAESGRSLGTGDEVGSWITRYGAQFSPDDLAATACRAIGLAISYVMEGPGDRLLIAGGGVKNAALVEGIRACGPATRVEPTDNHGVPAAYREAICFAILGALCQDRVPITLAQVTGAKRAALSGAWVYP